jgi:hypothetical protein
VKIVLCKEFRGSKDGHIAPASLFCVVDIPFSPVPGLGICFGEWTEYIEELTYDLTGEFFRAYVEDSPTPSKYLTPYDREQTLDLFRTHGWTDYPGGTIASIS